MSLMVMVKALSNETRSMFVTRTTMVWDGLWSKSTGAVPDRYFTAGADLKAAPRIVDERVGEIARIAGLYAGYVAYECSGRAVLVDSQRETRDDVGRANDRHVNRNNLRRARCHRSEIP